MNPAKAVFGPGQSKRAGTFRFQPFACWCEWGELNPHEHTLTAT